MRVIRIGVAAAGVAFLLAAATAAVPGKTIHQPHAVQTPASVPSNQKPHEPLPVVIVSQPPMPEDERRAIEAERAAKAASDSALVKWTEILGCATVLLALGTVALWWATRRLVKEAEHSSERELRSYLFVEPVLDELIATHGGQVASKIRARITNHGKTPAVLVRIRAITALSEQPPSELPSFPGSDTEIPNGVAVGPQYTHEVDAPVRISTEELGKIERLELGVYCYGRVDYEDVLGVRRQTGFCWYLRRHGGKDEFVIAPGTPLNFRT